MIKRLLAGILTICISLSLVSFGMASSPSHEMTDAEMEVLRIVNRERHAQGLLPLTSFAKMQKAGDIRANELITLFSHTRPDNTDCFTVFEEVGIHSYAALGENIAAGQTTPSMAMEDWMNSPGHRANILKESFCHIGIGHVYNSAAAYRNYWVQLFYTSWSCKYTEMKLYFPEGVDFSAGTTLDEMGIYAELGCKNCGACYLPIIAEYCGGFDAQKVGQQTVTVSCLGLSQSFTVNLVPKACGEGEHSVEQWKVSTPATCTAPGVESGICTYCGAAQTREIPATGHSYGQWKETKAPTCTEAGVESSTCSGCRAAQTREIPATGHSYGQWTESKAPTCTEAGVESSTCSACGAAQTREIPATGHSYGRWTESKAPTCTQEGQESRSCTVCGKEESRKVEMVPCLSKNYSDLSTNIWYHTGVDFMLKKGLMNGVGNGRFDPDGSVTRAMLVTILYRAEGSPSVAGLENPFNDVPKSWFTDAVIWAANNGIVNGVGNGRFDPNGPITREQIAAIVYRYDGSEAVTGDLSAFSDAASVSGYAKIPMIWATQKGLINGVGKGLLAPSDTATRAQIATILARYLQSAS